ncbi:MAG: 2-oxo acid dehydrogenase subunit E2 [Clostridia bacterium]|nr:2-oxo acid dehydrogenase subunit E2 [Clostridia bacterium]
MKNSSVELPENGQQAAVAPPKRKRRFGDRYDAYRVRNLDGFFHIIPNIMRERNDSQLFFEVDVPIEHIEKYVNQKRKQGLEIRMMHVFMAALVRTFTMRPRLNRFTVGKKIYSHNNLRVTMAIKRSLTIDGEETSIQPYFEPTDTIFDVCKRFEDCLEESRPKDGSVVENTTDGVVKVLRVLPTFLKTFVVFVLRNLDKVGLMPKIIYEASPFHSSCVVTDLGSLGIDSIYHHLYDFGTTSCFLAIGKKKTKPVFAADGTVRPQRYMTLRFVLDERCVDGYYYANAIKYYTRLLKHPELLEVPPEMIPDDM